MDKSYFKLLNNNKAWATLKKNNHQGYFIELAKGQNPEYLWIGCSDSRVSENQITGTRPGEIFVHRNIANMVVHSDMNLLSVLFYAVDILQVKHIIVCGHYGCGGIAAAMGNKQYGIIDNWLRHIKDVYRYHHEELDSIRNKEKRAKRLAELNVIEQVSDLGKTSIVQNAWKRKQSLHIHGWVFDIESGIIKDMEVTFKNPNDLLDVYQLKDIS
jgi:carbonic anhydrase